MRLYAPSDTLIASMLGVLLVACGTTRHVAAPDAAELTGYVLVIRELPDGSVAHEWQRAADAELSPVTALSSDPRPALPIVLAIEYQRDCDEELQECVRECMDRPLPRGFGHTTSAGRGNGGKEVYCNKRCMQPYLDCSKLQELRPQEFTATDSAVEWLKRHRESILVGSVVVIAGVVFVVVSAGVGLVILVPAVILASSETASGSEFCLAAVSR